MSTELIAFGDTAATSTAFTLADGAGTNVVLAAGHPGNAHAEVQTQDAGAGWTTIADLTGARPLVALKGPGVFRVKRRAGPTFAVDRADATAITAPVNSVAPAITGTTTTGNTLTCSQGTWTNAPSRTTTYAFQWKRGGVAISGATAATYVLAVADEGTAVTCEVTATNPTGATTQVSNTVNPTA